MMRWSGFLQGFSVDESGIFDETLTNYWLESRALSEGWKLKPHQRSLITTRLVKVVEKMDPARTRQARVLVGAGRALMSADLRQQALDWDREKHEGLSSDMSMETIRDQLRQKNEQLQLVDGSGSVGKLQERSEPVQ